MCIRKFLPLAAVILSFAAVADVKLGTPFSDGMVLQRDMDVAVWGTADPGETVRVEFSGRCASVRAAANGDWLVRLAKMPASCEPSELTVSGKNKVVVRDVLVGEVWYCCGQSNAELPLVGPHPHFQDRQGLLVAQMTRKKLVRYAYASNYKWSAVPRKEARYNVEWKTFTPENLGAQPSFSAMGVYFALELHDALDIPVGIVGSYWGGTNIDAWTPGVGYEGKPNLKDVAGWQTIPAEKWTAACNKGPINGPPEQPRVLWNEMVEPWCPMSMRGFIWYQGCHNAMEGHRYREKMHALYDGWSKKFENPALKLYFVQLAPFRKSWWDVQLAQAGFAAEEKNAALVTTVDIGNSEDVHPNEKGTIGKRLAALALKHDYGFDDIVADAPVLRSVRREGDKLRLSFENTAGGWYVYDSAWGVDCGFEISGEDGKWEKAWFVNANGGARARDGWKTRGLVDGEDIVLVADGVTEPVKVRYLYNKPWKGIVYAKSGLPLGPFESGLKKSRPPEGSL